MTRRLFGGIVLSSLPMAAEISPVGLWKTVDDKTHKPRGLVRLYEQNGAFFGKIEASFDPAEAGEKCGKCSGDRHDHPIIGLVFLRNMKGRNGEYSGGDILDPETGWTYRCKMNLEDNGKKLVVRGFLGFSLIGRSQTWYREQ